MWLLIKRMFILSTMSVFMALGACETTPTYNHLDAGARPHIKTVDSVLFAKQNNIGADVKEGSDFAKILAFAQASPIPLLADAAITGYRTISANLLAKPMREALEGFDYAVDFREQMMQSLEGSKLTGVDFMAIRRKEQPGFRAQFIEDSDADAVLFVDMKYAFTPDFGKLYVGASVMMFPNSDELKPFQEERGSDRVFEFTDNIYRNQFAAFMSPDFKDGGKAQNAIYWAGFTEEELTTRLQAASLRLADVIADDIGIDKVISDPDAAPAKDKAKEKIDIEGEDVMAAQAEGDAVDAPSDLISEQASTITDTPDTDTDTDIDS